MKCWRHWVLFLPSAMPAKGLVHCQKQPQVNGNEILWSISVITLWCQQRWSAWLNGDVAHFILRNPDDLCLESLLVYSWSAGTEPPASPDKVDIGVIPVLLTSGVASGEGAEEGVGEQTCHLLLRHGDGVRHACLEERHRLEVEQTYSEARSKSFALSIDQTRRWSVSLNFATLLPLSASWISHNYKQFSSFNTSDTLWINVCV